MVIITEQAGIYGGIRKICDLILSAMALQNEPQEWLFDTRAWLAMKLMATKYLHARAKQILGLFNWFFLVCLRYKSYQMHRRHRR